MSQDQELQQICEQQQREAELFINGDFDKMGVWSKVCKTNPKDTRKVNQRGGFTSICAQSQRKRATEMFGPFGIGWGLEAEKFYKFDTSNDPHDALIIFEADFYYFFKGVKGSFLASSEIELWSYTKKYDSWALNNDARKKVRTDAMTKALSEIGFNSDIFEGLYDDNKYVQQAQREFAEKEQKAEQVKQDKKWADHVGATDGLVDFLKSKGYEKELEVPPSERRKLADEFKVK